MSERPFKRITQGPLDGQLSAADLNRQQQAIEKASRAAGAGWIGGDSDLGGGFYSGEPERIAIRILSGSNPYAWEQVVEEPIPGGQGIMAWEPTDLTGTVDDLPAYEANGLATVPAGTIVRAWPDNVNGRFWFVYNPGISNNDCASFQPAVSFVSGGPITLNLECLPQGILRLSWSQPLTQITINACGFPQVVPAGLNTGSRTFDLCDCPCTGDTPPPCETVCDCPQCPCGAPCVWGLSYPASDTGEVWSDLDCAGMNLTKFNVPWLPLFARE